METKRLNYRRENCHFKFLGYFKNYPSCFSHGNTYISYKLVK